MDRAEISKARKRVKDDARVRAIIACDYCRKKRERCIREGRELDACVRCSRRGFECTTTDPRRMVFYQKIMKEGKVEARKKRIDQDMDRTELGRSSARRVTESAPAESSSQASSQSRSLAAVVPAPELVQPSHEEAEHPSSPQIASMRAAQQAPSHVIIPDNAGDLRFIGPSGSLYLFTHLRDVVRRQDSGHEFLRFDPFDHPTTVAHASGLPQLYPSHPSNYISRAVADALVDAYFSYVHADVAIFHRGTFLARYHAFWSSSSSLSCPDSHGWSASVAMIFVLGSTALQGSPSPPFSQELLANAQQSSISLVNSLIPSLLSASHLSNIQSLLLLGLHLHAINERTAAWNIIGAAIRSAIVLGFHRRDSVNHLPLDVLHRQLVKRVFWSLYSFEIFLCQSLGRPSALQDSDIDLDMPDETLLDPGPHFPLDFVSHQVSVSRFVARICRKLFDPINHPLPNAENAQLILADLHSWYHSIPSHLAIDAPCPPSHQRAITLLHLNYHSAVSLATRPFLLSHSHEDLYNCCLVSASESTRLLSRLHKAHLFNSLTAPDVFFTYSSAMTLAVPLILRHFSHASGGNEISRVNHELEMEECLAVCVDILKGATLSPTMACFAQVVFKLADVVTMGAPPINFQTQFSSPSEDLFGNLDSVTSVSWEAWSQGLIASLFTGATPAEFFGPSSAFPDSMPETCLQSGNTYPGPTEA